MNPSIEDIFSLSLPIVVPLITLAKDVKFDHRFTEVLHQPALVISCTAGLTPSLAPELVVAGNLVALQRNVRTAVEVVSGTLRNTLVGEVVLLPTNKYVLLHLLPDFYQPQLLILI